MFVQNVDEVVFGLILILCVLVANSDILTLYVKDACCPQEITQEVGSTRFAELLGCIASDLAWQLSGEVAGLDSHVAARFIDQLGVLLWQAYLADLLDF